METNRRSDSRSSFPRREIPDHGCGAFTLTELLVVLATVAILAVVLLPAFASTQPRNAKIFQCLNNMRQMAVAWTMYAGDNHDRLVNNFGTLSTQTEINWVNDTMSWNVSPSVTNLDGIQLAPFYQYTRGLGVYKCPADNYLSGVQLASGWTARPRSYSMNCYFGATTPTWTSSGNEFFPNYRQFLKTSAMPNPANLYVMLEEHPDSINDGYFVNNASPAISQYLDLPGSNHAGSAGFSFADGHSEIHKWKSRVCTMLSVRFGPFSTIPFGADVSGAAFQDGQWLAAHSSVPR
jgi:prepilin-type processing-associated H-X9-DG protein